MSEPALPISPLPGPLHLPIRRQRRLTRFSGIAEATDSYDQGYRACLARLARLLPAWPVLDPAARACLLEHLRWRAARAIPDGARAFGQPCQAPVPYPSQIAPVPPRPQCQPSFWRPW